MKNQTDSERATLSDISFEPLKALVESNLHSEYYNTLVLKSCLNTLSYKKIIQEDATQEALIAVVNTYKNQKELFEYFKLSTNNRVSFKDMIIPSLAEPIVEFH